MHNLLTDTITVYNSYLIDDPPSSYPKTLYRRTVIYKVQWTDDVHRSHSSEGRFFISKIASVIIPKDANTGGKRFIEPKEYAKLPPGDSSHWTLATSDIIVKGVCPAEITDSYSIAQLKKDYNATDIQGYSDMTDQPYLPHWDVQGV